MTVAEFWLLYEVHKPKEKNVNLNKLAGTLTEESVEELYAMYDDEEG